ncbi:hypothetical protein FQN57_006198 [Myotisia sp. PD_48]|nr:hypothetical protein FQN57_006198 [Myotisia sp. PD_48]
MASNITDFAMFYAPMAVDANAASGRLSTKHDGSVPRNASLTGSITRSATSNASNSRSSSTASTNQPKNQSNGDHLHKKSTRNAARASWLLFR